MDYRKIIEFIIAGIIIILAVYILYKNIKIEMINVVVVEAALKCALIMRIKKLLMKIRKNRLKNIDLI